MTEVDLIRAAIKRFFKTYSVLPTYLPIGFDVRDNVVKWLIAERRHVNVRASDKAIEFFDVWLILDSKLEDHEVGAAVLVGEK